LAKLEEIEKLLTKANALGWEGQVNTLPIRVAQVVSSRDDAWRVNDIRLKLINELSDDNAKLLAKLEKQEIIIAAVRVQQDMVKAAQVVGASVFKELWVELLGYAKQLNELSMTTAEPYMVARNIAGKMFTGPIACLKQLESMNARSVETPKAGVESGTK
jgi:hypothetical protein